MMFHLSAFGSNSRTLFEAIAATSPFVERSPLEVHVDRSVEVSHDQHWVREALARTKETRIDAVWLDRDGGRYTGPFLALDPWGQLTWTIPESEISLDALLAGTARLPLEIMVLGPRYRNWLDLDLRPLFGFWGLLKHGLGVMLRGAGHGRIVSQRWLEHGPWLVRRMSDDTTWIQFHDPAAGADEAWDQAVRGHERMGDSDEGGYLVPGRITDRSLHGLYYAAERCFVLVRASLFIAQADLSSLCEYRAHMRNDTAQPVERVRVLFNWERDARRYLHELWLREIECWCFDDAGREVRLDDRYTPELIKPEWIERAEGRAPRVARPEVRLSLGLGSLFGDHSASLADHDAALRRVLQHGHEMRPADYTLHDLREQSRVIIASNPGVIDMATAEAAALHAKAAGISRQIEVAYLPERLGLTLPAIIVPDPNPEQRPIKFDNGHPLDGVIVHPVSDVLARVRSLNRQDLRGAEAMLRLCAEDRLVLAATCV